MTITGGSALSKDDIDRMVHEAEQYAEEDRQRREEVETRNQADSLVYSTEKFLTDNADKIGEDVRTEVQADVDALKKALEADDLTAVREAVTKLGESSQRMGAAMYAQAGADQPDASEGGPAGDAGAEDVVEAEIVDEDEKK